jgi:hypothetical protein
MSPDERGSNHYFVTLAGLHVFLSFCNISDPERATWAFAYGIVLCLFIAGYQVGSKWPKGYPSLFFVFEPSLIAIILWLPSESIGSSRDDTLQPYRRQNWWFEPLDSRPPPLPILH